MFRPAQLPISKLMFIMPRTIDRALCQQLAQEIETHWQTSRARGIEATGFDAGARSIRLADSALCSQVTQLIEQHVRVKLTLASAELCIWPTISPPSGLHKHDWNGREHTDYNSILYLNDDFAGGQFYDEHGLSLKPTTGTVTFFNGQTVMHGVRPTLVKNRCTAVFWWQNTVWY